MSLKIVELSSYVKETKAPSFSDFVQLSSKSLIAWSTDKANLDAKQLFSLWRNCFTLCLREHNKIQPTSDRYEIDVNINPKIE